MKQWAAKYLLEHSEPALVFEWLKNNQIKERDILGESRDELEEALLGRKDPVINLGLALYGSDTKVGEKLYREGNESIKRAVLSGSTVSPGLLARSWIVKLLPAILTEWNDDNLAELFSNNLIPDDVLVELFERKEPYDSLADEKWVLLCGYASSNDRLSTPYDSNWMDGWDEYKYELVFTSAWWLFDKFPRTPLAANILIGFGDKLVARAPHDMEVMAVIEKWNTELDHDNADLFAMTRSYLANLIPSFDDKFKTLKESDDLALRQAYYRNLQYPKPDDIKQGFEKDGEKYIDSALYNESIFANEDAREALSKACWDAPDENSYMDLPNLFNARSEYWASKHPEWFKDEWSGELPFDEIENQDERIEKRIEYINTQINDIHKNLLGKSDEYDEDSEQNTIDYLKSELEAIAQLLVKIYNRNSVAWGWVIAGIAIGYIIARL